MGFGLIEDVGHYLLTPGALDVRVAPRALDAPEDPFEADSHAAFTTETMADLLESQGDPAAAAAVRDAMPALPEPAVDAVEAWVEPSRDYPAAEQQRILATLERWLQNIQRGVA